MSRSLNCRRRREAGVSDRSGFARGEKGERACESKGQLATLKDEEWDLHGVCERRKELRSQVDSERRRHDRLVEEKSWVVC